MALLKQINPLVISLPPSLKVNNNMLKKLLSLNTFMHVIYYPYFIFFQQPLKPQTGA